MSIESPGHYTEAELLYRYIGEQVSNGGRDASVKELLQGYAEYRRQLEDLRGKLRQAEASSARGESEDFDIEQLITEMTAELAAEGITG